MQSETAVAVAVAVAISETACKPEPITLAIDVEMRGESPLRNGILAVGIATSTGIRKTWNVGPIPGMTYSEKCKQEFWRKHTDLQAMLEKDPVPWLTFTHDFRKFIDQLNADGELYIIASSHSDVEFINVYLDLCALPTMQFDMRGKYRHIHDTESYSRGAIGATPSEQWVCDKEIALQYGFNIMTNEQEHDPSWDAAVMLDFHQKLTTAHATLSKNRPHVQ
jgi:hypothetical protein